GKPQLKMVDSEVPVEPKKAKADLVSLLRDNLNDFTPLENDRELIMQGWSLLCKNYSPIFLEKSPHYLCQWSALELIVEHIHEVNDVDFLLIGLIRNPMDTIYSQFKRWKSPPEKVEKQWLTAYQNLLRLREIHELPLAIVRYEDIVSSLKSLEPVFSFCGVSATADDESYVHTKSIGKWKNDKLFGLSLSHQTIELAEKFRYQKSELVNNTHPLWVVFRKSLRAVHWSIKLRLLR
ncbi:MAG: hypothetical protein WBB01_03665, partial [Phormidesmis sp.]